MRDNLPEDIKIGGYGDALIFHTFKTTMQTAEKVGIRGIIADAKNNDACVFYEGFGFKKLKITGNKLGLPITALSKLL